jgi:hypothetical protein
MIGTTFAIAMAAAAQTPSAVPSIGKIRMQLFYEDSGRLSGDIAPPAEFSGWNTVIGEGSAEEPANDLLVTVEILTGEVESVEQPLSVTVRGNRKILGQRRFTDVLASADGRTWKALWLTNVACAGHVEVTASIGRSTRKTSVSLDCGE